MLDIYYLWSKSLYQVNSPNTHHQVCRRPSSTACVWNTWCGHPQNESPCLSCECAQKINTSWRASAIAWTFLCAMVTSTSCCDYLSMKVSWLTNRMMPLIKNRGQTNCTNMNTHTHIPFNGPFSGTTRVSRYQKGKTDLDFTEARDSEWQWHQLGHMRQHLAPDR